MRFLFFIMSLVFLFSCTENDKKLDNETNSYYAKYLYIYNNQDSLGIEQSIKLLDEYIEEFPNAQNAYLFKAWLLAEEKDFEAVNSVFSLATEKGLSDPNLYSTWASLLLKDSSSFNKAQEINNEGLKLSKDNIELLHNETWIHLFNEQKDLALKNALNVFNSDSLNDYRYSRVVLISNIGFENDSISKMILKDIDFKKKDSIDLYLFKNNEMSLLDLYNKKLDK